MTAVTRWCDDCHQWAAYPHPPADWAARIVATRRHALAVLDGLPGDDGPDPDEPEGPDWAYGNDLADYRAADEWYGRP